MKQHKRVERGDHVVPLPPGLLAKLREWHAVDGEGAEHVCPAPRDPKRAITPEAVEKHYRDVLKLAGKHSPHSWRSTFSTVCREAGKDGDTIEAQLDHIVGTKVASAYDRAKRLELRRELMRWYEATLLAARDGADVVPISGMISHAAQAAR
jgi:integrase